MREEQGEKEDKADCITLVNGQRSRASSARAPYFGGWRAVFQSRRPKRARVEEGATCGVAYPCFGRAGSGRLWHVRSPSLANHVSMKGQALHGASLLDGVLRVSAAMNWGGVEGASTVSSGSNNATCLHLCLGVMSLSQQNVRNSRRSVQNITHLLQWRDYWKFCTRRGRGGGRGGAAGDGIHLW